MTKREPVEPTVDRHGSDTHPAFGMVSASRISWSPPGTVLFDSDITHNHTVRVTVSRATRKRDLNHDWIHGNNKELIEIEMSEAQWASFVSSMNTSGVPCTIRSTESDWNVPGLPYDPRLKHSMDEVKGAADKTFSRIKRALADYEQAVSEKAGAKVLREKLRNLHFAVEHVESNLTFAAKSLTEHAENVVQRARADIEAMVVTEARRLGVEPHQVLELPE